MPTAPEKTRPVLARLRREKPPGEEAFSILELMVAVALLSVMIVGLLAMFYQVQRAFRLGTAQADVMEGGRAAMNIIAGEIGQMTAVGVEFSTNFVVVPSGSPPLPVDTFTVQALPSGQVRQNVLKDFCFFKRINDEWIGVSYRLSNSVSGVGTLYRWEERRTNDTDPVISATIREDLSAYISTALPVPGTTNTSFRPVVDGVVHLAAFAYDTNGMIFTNAAERIGYYGYGFIGDELPAYVDLEMGLLEPSVLNKFRARYEVNAERATNYLAQIIGGTHLFRQRVEVKAGQNASAE